ncbi:mus81 structure-specific endonuclease subunit isoform X2 [Lycorma delicatula]
MKSGRDCMILENFGPQLCLKLDQKLTEFRNQYPDAEILRPPKSSNIIVKIKNKKTQTKKFQPPKSNDENLSQTETQCTKRRKKIVYIPDKGTGGYALLLTLHKHNIILGKHDGMEKKELMMKAQELCHSSFTHPLPGLHYTAWAAMGILCRKSLVTKVGNPPRYLLTDEGNELAQRLKDSVPENDLIDIKLNPSPSTSKQTQSSINVNESQPSTSGLSLQSSSTSAYSRAHTFSSSDDDDDLRAAINNLIPHQSSFIGSNDDDDDDDDDVNSNYVSTNKRKPTCTIVRPEEDVEYASQRNEKDIFQVFSQANSKTLRVDKNSENKYDEDIFNTLSPKRNKLKPPSPDLSQTSLRSSQLSTDSQPKNIEMLFCNCDLILLIDIAEVSGKSDATAIQNKLQGMSVVCEVRKLNVGDYVWICRDVLGNELMLPYIVERKRIDDLSKSIKDGRFHEQKFRLKNLPVMQRIYIVEGLGKRPYTGLSLKTLNQAVCNTQIVDGFIVKHTSSFVSTLKYLVGLYIQFRKLLFGKKLVSCKTKLLPPFSWNNAILELMIFNDVMKNASKKKKFTVREMFVRHLLQLHGLSLDKAKTIVEKYPCPRLLFQAYQEGGGENLLAKLKAPGVLGRCIGSVISKTIHDLYNKD